MREPLMQGNPSGTTGARWVPDAIELPRPRVLVASLLAVAVVVLAAVLAVGNVASIATGPASIRGRELGSAQLPTGAALAIARGLGADDHAFWARPGPGGWVARSKPVGISTRFTRSRVAVKTSAGTVGLSLVAERLGGAWRAITKATPTAHANRVVYQRDGLSEWYANTPLGLEQGLTIASAPRAVTSRTLSFGFAISGTLQPRLDAGALTFRDRAGGTSLNYADLQVTDARGRLLPATIMLRRDRLILRINAAGARYPIKVDPLLTPAGGAGAPAEFGQSVAESGSTIVVGAPAAGGSTVAGGAPGAGAAYVFVEPPSGWQNATQNATLTAAGGASNDRLGSKVAITTTPAGTTTVFASAPYQNNYDGGVYVFNEPSGGWGTTGATVQSSTELTVPAVQGQYYELGVSLAATTSPKSGLSTVVAGAPYSNAGDGAAYVFAEPPNGWVSSSSPTATLQTTGPGSLGTSVAIASSPTTGLGTVVAGAPEGNSAAGAADVFAEPTSGWPAATLTSTLTATGGQTDDELGSSVSIAISSSGAATVAAGAPDATVSSIAYAGAAYVFVEPSDGTWASSTSQAATLTSSKPAMYDEFADAVATTGSEVFVADNGVPNSSGSGSTAGLWGFDESASGWGSGSSAAGLTYAGDSADEYGLPDGLLAVQGGTTSSQPGATAAPTIAFLGQPGDGDVDVICPSGGKCPPLIRTSKVAPTCKASVTIPEFTCTAVVSDASGVAPAETPTKTATLTASSGNFVGSSICTLKLIAAGRASCTATYNPTATSSLKGATVSITASYSGDANFSPSAAVYKLKVPKSCKVPKLVRVKESPAKTALKKANCATGKVTMSDSLKVAKGAVISSSPKAGTSHKSGTKVALKVSSG